MSELIRREAASATLSERLINGRSVGAEFIYDLI